MIKLILLFCLLSIASYAQKSIYPLPYQFDDTYFITLVGQNNPMKPSSFEVVLSSTDEDKLILTQNYLLPLNFLTDATDLSRRQTPGLELRNLAPNAFQTDVKF